MFHYGKAELIYISSSAKDTGSPTELKITKTCKVTETKQFSLNFYSSANGKQRLMRKSKNIVVPINFTEDIVQDGKRYELTYVNYNNLKYQVHNILNYRKSGLRMLLDIEELR